MYAVPRALPEYRRVEFRGHVVYPDERVSIGHTFLDNLTIPEKKPRVSLRGMLPPLSKKEYEKQYSKEIYKWARGNGLCIMCKKTILGEPDRLRRLPRCIPLM